MPSKTSPQIQFGEMRQLGLFRVFLLGALCHSLAIFAAPHSPVAGCNNFFETLIEAGVDSSAELEIGRSMGTLALFTTSDGTLAPILQGAQLPAALEAKLKEVYPEISDLRTLEWDALDHESQVELIEHAAKQSNQDFFKNRKVPGLVYRDTIELRFTQTTEFMGKTYRAGTYKFSGKDVFNDTHIEFKGPNNMSSNLGFELHLRASDAPSVTLKNSWALERGMGYLPGNLHQHLVAPIPSAKLEANPVLQAARMSEYYRRINLYAEMNSILRGSSITTNEAETFTNFANMDDEVLSVVFHYFSEGATESIGSSAKMGWVGMRGSDAYRGSEKLWGLEFRDLSPKYNADHLGRMLDAAQNSIVKDNYGIPEEQIERWLRRAGSKAAPAPQVTLKEKFFKVFGVQPAPKTLPLNEKETWKEIVRTKYAEKIDYHRSSGANYLDVMDPELTKRLNLSADEIDRLSETLISAHKNDRAVTLLTKNWTQDPLFFESPEVIQRIRKVQAQALRRLLGGEKENSVMQYFLKRSGIHYMFEKSLGI